jgi:N-succinyldiaminopimelate aminotransferase
MNPDLSLLHAYPFEKQAVLFKGLTPPSHLKPVALSIGEPKHPSPSFVIDIINQQAKHASGDC